MRELSFLDYKNFRVTSTLRHQFVTNGQIAGPVRVSLRAQDMASLRGIAEAVTKG